MIVNPKTVEGIDVIQLETAMGAAISIFDNAKAILVNRDRFTPVKKTQDLVLIWSDIYELKEDFTLNKLSQIDHILDLDSTYYGEIDQTQKRFAEGIPSLKECPSLTIKGDISFGKNTIFKGQINLQAFEPTKLANIKIEN